MRLSKSVSVVCCGRFHYHNWVFMALAKGVVSEFIFSHRYDRGHSSRGGVLNLFFKEYMVRASMRFLPDSFFLKALLVAHSIWDFQCRFFWRRTDLLHVLVHGNCLRLLRHAKRSGAVIIGEAVNTHPENLHRVIESERLRCGLAPKLKMDRHWERLIEELSFCDYLLVPSKAVFDSYVVRGFDPSRIFIVPFGANISNFKPGDFDVLRPGVFNVVCVAQVGARKGIRDLLETWRRLNWGPADARLTVIGRIDSEMAMLIRSRPAGVVFTGALTREELTVYLQTAHVFFLPTLEEGMAISILEAMACGCVPVTTYESGADSIIKDGWNGFLSPAHDVDGFCVKLSKLKADRPLLKLMRGFTLDSIRTGFTWGDYLLKIEGVYDCISAHD